MTITDMVLGERSQIQGVPLHEVQKQCHWVKVSTTELVLASGAHTWGSNLGRRVAGATVGERGTTLESTRGLLSNPREPFHTDDVEEESEEGEYNEVTEEVTQQVCLPAKAAKEGEACHYPSALPHYFEEKEWPDPLDLSFPEDTGQKVVAPVTVQAAHQATAVSSIQAGIQQARREGDMNAWQFPVRIHPPDQQGNIIATFEPFPFEILK
nr:uncharacterized protein LOC105493316 [Macaca nemestrina]